MSNIDSNLHCAGCYSRCNHATVDAEPVSQMTSDEWFRIFDDHEGGCVLYEKRELVESILAGKTV